MSNQHSADPAAESGREPKTDTDLSREVAALTLEQKASLTSGTDFWNTQAVPDAGIRSIMLTDGPHGLRKQVASGDHLGIADSVPATCFPPAVGLGSSFDTELIERVGRALGRECRIENVSVLLGPGINIKRSPLCGRNFEYFSEDPLLAGAFGTAWVKGVQSQGVGTSLKHFAANNQEHDRMRVNADVDSRTLHEIYLRGFRRVVTQAQPWTVMCSYNRINGVYASEDPWLLTRVLRDAWGFDGLVVSDWGAVNDRVAGLAAGLDLEMPSSGGRTDAQIVDAVRSGELDEAVLDQAAERMLHLVRRAENGSPEAKRATELDVDAHHALAREAAGRSMVLLRNEGDLLPLQRSETLAVIGAFAAKPRYQGAGSSLINPTRLDTALDGIRAASDAEVSFAAGFPLEDAPGEDSDAAALREEAVEAARRAQTCVVFLGLPARAESEGYDRTSIDLPAEQLDLLEAVRQANPRTVVVLSNGSVVALPFRDEVPAILEAWLLGQAGGSATADVLFGDVAPSGRLTETIPLRLQDTPAYGNFPGSFGRVRYGEGIFVGYRWYDHRDLPVAYPFGHGLSYTTFGYGDARARVQPSGDVTVTVPVTNTGRIRGREVVQAYLAPSVSAVERAPRELKAFAVVDLDAGESRDVSMTVARDDLAYWDVRVDDWIVEPGTYRVEVGASSRDIRSVTEIEVAGDEVRVPLSADSSVGELLSDRRARAALDEVLAEAGLDLSTALPGDDGILEMMASFPIGRLGSFPGMPIDEQTIDRVIERANAAD